MDKATESRAARGYDYSSPPSGPRYDLLNWPHIKIGDLPPQRGIELNADGTISFKTYTDTIGSWLKKCPDPIVPITPEPVTYDYVDAIRLMAEQMTYLVDTVTVLKSEVAALKVFPALQ